MIHLSLESLAHLARDSDFLHTLREIRRDAGIRWALGGEPVRALREAEIQELVADGNTAEDWRRVRVADGFRPGRVRHSDFHGYVTLGRFEESVVGPGGVELPSGIIRSTLVNCVVGHESLIRNVEMLSGYTLGERAVVAACGRIVCDGMTTFGNGVSIPIGPQCGGRWILTFAELTLDLADNLTAPTAKFDEELHEGYTRFLTDYLDQVRIARGVIGPGATICHVPVIRNTYIGPGAELDAATRIDSTTLLSSPEEPVRLRDGVCISESVIQWGARICDSAFVERSVVLEHAAVERGGKLTDSVLGPNSSLGGAEVTASLVGPFVGAHHEGLLIAARWPGGRGNLGYGAAVGCNHTSRAPDQEAILGEGLFVGLGAKLQYPADLSRAPYSVLASGVSLPPQKIAFPFSLIRPASEPTPGAPQGANVLVPGWVLSENLYAIQRSALKFRARDRASRHNFHHEVFRPEIMAIVADALRRLERPVSGREVYTEREIPGLGRNILIERHRVAAIRCFADHLERFHLLKLLERATRALATDRGAALRRLTDTEGSDAWQGLSRLGALLEAFGAAVERSKARDEERGPSVIEDYAVSHAPTSEDPVVRQTWQEVRHTQAQLAEVLTALGQLPRHERTAPLVGGS